MELYLNLLSLKCSEYAQKFNNDRRRKEVAIGKVVVHLCPTLFIKEFKISVEQDRVVTTLNTIKH
jgi:hypothetical protein